MISGTSAPVAPPTVDWDDWRLTLQRFAAATGLAVSAFDARGTRHVGPLHSGQVAGLIERMGAWDELGRALQEDRALAARAFASGKVERCRVAGELHLQATPVVLAGAVSAVVVHGWVFSTFTTSLACQRIGSQLGIDGGRLWAEARLEPPVPSNRMAMYGELLETLVAASGRHAAAMERVAALGRLREVFLAGVTHELRTPLSALALRIEVLLRGTLADPEDIRAHLLRMKQQVATQAMLVEDLIDSARTRTGQLSIKSALVDLSGLLQTSLAAVMPHAEAKGVRISAGDPALLEGASVEGDAHRLQQVFWNLLSNAVKFTPSGGEVELRVLDRGHAIETVVADSGEGIDPALLPLVFDAFTKQHEGNSQGLGLGLSIARHIVHLHGGSIWVESPGPGCGATFHVLLPKAHVAADAPV